MNTLVSIESYFWVHSFSRVSFSSWFSKSIVFLFSIKKFNFRFYNDTETWTSDWISFLIQIRKRCIYLEISFFFNYKNFFQNFNTYAYIWRTCLEYAYVYEKKKCVDIYAQCFSFYRSQNFIRVNFDIRIFLKTSA